MLKKSNNARVSLRLAIAFLVAVLIGASQAPPDDRDLAQSAAATATDDAGELLRGAIEAGGGWQSWSAKQTVAFTKRTKRYAADGAFVSERVEQHRYILQPSMRMRIEWTERGKQHLLINNGQQAFKFLGGSLATTEADRNHAWNATFGSHYMFAVPFKLADESAILSLSGQLDVQGSPADGLQVDYEPGAGSTGGLMTWTYYFDLETQDLVAYFLKFGESTDDYRFTEYFDPVEVAGLRMPAGRRVYSSDATRSKLTLLSEISHEDIEFDIELADALFEPPR